jgi:hypothetical protein
MPGSLQSYRSFDHSIAGADGQAESHEDDNEYRDEDYSSNRPTRSPPSPTFHRSRSYRAVDEMSSLLENPDHRRTYHSRRSSIPGTPRTLAALGRQNSHAGSMRIAKNHSRSGSLGLGFSQRLVSALDRSRNSPLEHCEWHMAISMLVKANRMATSVTPGTIQNLSPPRTRLVRSVHIHRLGP